MKIKSALLGAFFALTLSVKGELRFEKPAQPVIDSIKPSSVRTVLAFDAVGGVGSGFIGAIKIEVSNEVGGAFKGARLRYNGVSIEPISPFIQSTAWLYIGGVIKEGVKVTFEVELIAREDLRTFSGTHFKTTIIDAQPGGEYSGLPLSGETFKIQDTRVKLSIGKVADSIVITGSGEPYAIYELQSAENFNGSWIANVPRSMSDHQGHFRQVFDLNDLSPIREFFRALRTSTSFGIAVDAISPASRIVLGGEEVTVGMFRLLAGANEITVTELSFEGLRNGFSAPLWGEVPSISLWDGNVKIGEAPFLTERSEARIILSKTIPANSFKVLTLKAQTGEVGIGGTARSGARVAIGILPQKSKAMSQGEEVSGFSGIARTHPFTIHKSFPTFVHDGHWSRRLNGGRSLIHRFSIEASPKGDIAIGQLSAKILRGNNVSITDVTLNAYEDSALSITVSGLNADGSFETSYDTAYRFTPERGDEKTILVIPAGQKYYFGLHGTLAVSGIEPAVVSVSILGDEAPLVVESGSFETIASFGSNFIWMPFDSSSKEAWTNGYLVPGVPSPFISYSLF